MTALSAHNMTLLQNVLEKEFVPHLPLLEDQTKPVDQQAKKNVSRAFSAYALQKLCEISSVDAAAAVVDDFDDFGIDAIFYHGSSETLYVVQGKLKASETFSQDEANAFCQGVRRLIKQDFKGFNGHVLSRQADIEGALEACSHIQLVVAHTGSGISNHAETAINDLLNDDDHGEERLKKAVNPGDLILDSFAGSGTAGAVAHKMGRRWIMVELGDHCFTHIEPRLRKVIDGTDQGGISAAVEWKGGGGFRYYELAPSLLQKDKWGREVISKDYNAEMLAQALCQLEGFVYARENGERIVKPFVLVIARDTTHAAELMGLIRSDAFFEGRYADKVIQVDSSVKEEETVEKLLTVEHSDNPVEIVIHVNMLKEGWDVTNLYTIVPLRAANARTLIEQSIGRGLRLPYGRRTGVTAVDRLNIVAHDRFQEIVDEANNPSSPIRLKQLVLDDADLTQKTVTVVAAPTILTGLGLQSTWTGNAPTPGAAAQPTAVAAPAPAFTDPDEIRVAQLAYDAFRKLAREPDKVPSASYLSRPEVQALVVREVQSQYQPAQLELEAVGKPAPDVEAVIAATAKLMAERTIDIPRIIVMPKGEVKAGFRPFTLDLSGMRYAAPSEELWAKHLRTDQVDVIGLSRGNLLEERLEDYVVSGLIDFSDIAYDEHADLLYELAGQVVRHLRSYLSEQEAGQVLALHQREIARAVHAQMQDHFWLDDTVEYHHEVRQGWTELKESAFTALNEPPLDYHVSPADKSNMARYLFDGFVKCLSTITKFHSESERKLAVILEREALKWLRPAKGQFQMFYRSGSDHLEYQPDFVAEMDDCVVMLEPKMASQMTDRDVLAKRDVAVQWCGWASEHARTYGGKPWRYALIPHDAIVENMTLAFLLKQYEAKA